MLNDGKQKHADQSLPEWVEADLEEAVERSYGKKIVAPLSDLNDDSERQ